MGVRERCKRLAIRAVGADRAAFLDRPIFVVACGRSGSTALCNALNEHPRVHMPEREAPLIHKIGEVAYDYACSEKAAYCHRNVDLPEADVVAELRRFAWRTVLGPAVRLSMRPLGVGRKLSAVAPDRHLRHWGAKVYPGREAAEGLSWLFPELRYVYLYRNGIDVVRSMAEFPGFSRMSFEERCDQWRWRAEMYDYLREHERAVTVRFEDFVGDAEAELARVIEALGLPADDGPARYASSTMVHPLERRDTVRADPRSELAKREPAYASWTSAERETFKRRCGASMARLGYDVPF